MGYMDRQIEMPFFTPYKEPAKFYKRFTFDTAMALEDSEIVVKLQDTNFVTHDKIKYKFVKRLDNARYVPTNSVVMNGKNVFIQSNTLKEISQGDVLWMKNNFYPKGQFFIVSGTVEQEFAHFPEARKTVCNIPLTTIDSIPNDN